MCYWSQIKCQYKSRLMMHGGMKFPVEANVMEKSDKNLPVEKHSSSIVH